MDQPTTFFVPFAAEGDQEARYLKLARRAGASPAGPGRRVRSITFESRGEIWTATVGERLRGIAETSRRVRGQVIERVHHRSDPSIVTAIFEGDPYRVCHDGASRAWENPFWAGGVRSVSYFDT